MMSSRLINKLSHCPLYAGASTSYAISISKRNQRRTKRLLVKVWVVWIEQENTCCETLVEAISFFIAVLCAAGDKVDTEYERDQ